MSIVLKQKIQIASRNYPCDACENLTVDDFMHRPDNYKVSYADKRILVKIRQEGFKVLKGTQYLYQVGVFDGDFYAIHCRLDAVDICEKYDLYDDY